MVFLPRYFALSLAFTRTRPKIGFLCLLVLIVGQKLSQHVWSNDLRLVAQSNNVAHNSVQPSKHLDGKLLGISWCSWRGIQNPASKMSFLADGVFVYLKSSGIIGNNPGHGETVKLASWGLSIQRSNQRVNFNKGAVAWHALVTPI